MGTLLRKCSIFEKIQDRPTNHAATLEIIRGKVLCIWYSGKYECSEDLVLMGSYYDLKENFWTKPRIVLQADRPLGNPVLFRFGNELRLFYVKILRDWWDSSILLASRSLDAGLSWEEGVPLLNEVGVMVRNRPLVLRDNRILLPAYDEKELTPRYLILNEDYSEIKVFKLNLRYAIQPAVVELSDNELLLAFRNVKRGYLIFGILRDVEDPGNLRTFTCKNLFNPNSAIELLKTKSGKFLLILNNSKVSRSTLSIARSSNGVDWELVYEIERGMGEYSYPCAVQDERGYIHICYTFREGTPPSNDFRYHAYGAVIKHLLVHESLLI